MKVNGRYDMKYYRCVLYAGQDNCIDTFDIETLSC